MSLHPDYEGVIHLVSDRLLRLFICHALTVKGWDKGRPPAEFYADAEELMELYRPFLSGQYPSKDAE